MVIARRIRRCQQVAVRIDDQRILWREIGRDLHLRPQNAFAASQLFDMRNADIRDQRDIRPHQIGKTLDFTEVVHPHFKDCHLGVRREFQNAQRQTETVVEIFHAARRFAVVSDRIIQQVARARLADTACHRDLMLQRQHCQIICRKIL